MCTFFDLYRICAYIFDSQRICAQFLTCIGFVPAYQFSEDMCTSSVFFLSNLYGVSCLHVQFPEDMCTNYDLHKICACIFNSWKICAQFLYFDLLDYFWMKDPLGMLEDSLGSITQLRSVLVMILTYHEVLMVYGPLGGGSLLGIF